MNLHGQTAIISGGLGDIGRAIALELAQHGADIAIGDVLPARRAGPLLKQLERLGRQARYDRADVSDAKAVTRWVRNVEKSLGVPTLIIPNAAIVIVTSIRKLTPAQWRREMSINLDGAFHLAQAAGLRLLARGKPGRIVFIGSWAGHVPHTYIPSYCVTKAGLRMLCKVMAADFAPDGILVNEVAPGFVDAGMTGRDLRRRPGSRREVCHKVPIKKLMSAEEVAREVAHFCDPLNRQMTGTVSVIDGGLSLVSP